MSRANEAGAMRLWMLADVTVWENLQHDGFLYANPAYGLDADALADPYNSFELSRGAYDWMRLQMSRRIPGYSGRYPWWAWHTHEGQRRVDLRKRDQLHWGLHGDHKVRLTLDVPDAEVLLSDYDHWHAVMNGASRLAWEGTKGTLQWWHTIPISVREERAMPRLFKQMDYPQRAAYVMQNWERVFLLQYPRRRKEASWGWGPAGISKNIQACFEVLRLDNVEDVTHFLSRPPKSRY